MGEIMRFFITLSRKNLFIILLVMVFGLILAVQSSAVRMNRPDGSTNAMRVAFLETKGIFAEDSSVTSKNIIIPEEFSDVYEEYNTIQKKAGFDLSRHKGEDAVLYTYPLTENTEAHLIVCKGVIIGGDIASVELGGEMKPLK